MLDPVDDNTHYIWNTFYFNKGDRRVLVPKRVRWFGFTVNFAQPVTYLVLMMIILLAFTFTGFA
jgi:uncharacterized membrane protein